MALTNTRKTNSLAPDKLDIASFGLVELEQRVSHLLQACMASPFILQSTVGVPTLVVPGLQENFPRLVFVSTKIMTVKMNSIESHFVHRHTYKDIHRLDFGLALYFWFSGLTCWVAVLRVNEEICASCL